MILAVPEQHTTVASGIGVPEHTVTLTWYRWWCSICHVPATVYASHAIGALEQGDWHLATVQCHTEGQLSLLPPTPQDWGFPAGAR